MASNCAPTAARCSAAEAVRRPPPVSAVARACSIFESAIDCAGAAGELSAAMFMRLVDHELRLERAAAFERLENCHHVARGDAEGVERGGETLDARLLGENREGALALVDGRLRALHR